MSRVWLDVLPEHVAKAQGQWERGRRALRMRAFGMALREMIPWCGVTTHEAVRMIIINAERTRHRTSPVEKYFAEVGDLQRLSVSVPTIEIPKALDLDIQKAMRLAIAFLNLKQPRGMMGERSREKVLEALRSALRELEKL